MIYKLMIFCSDSFSQHTAVASHSYCHHRTSLEAPPPPPAAATPIGLTVSALKLGRDSSAVRSSGPSGVKQEGRPRGWTGCSGPPPHQRHCAEPPGGTEVFRDRWDPESLWLVYSRTSQERHNTPKPSQLVFYRAGGTSGQGRMERREDFFFFDRDFEER